MRPLDAPIALVAARAGTTLGSKGVILAAATDQDLWRHLAVLEGSCEVDLRTVRDPAPGVAYVWRLTIRRRGMVDAIVVDAPKPLHALTAGIAAARQRGWLHD